jgi:hypothetical protein
MDREGADPGLGLYSPDDVIDAIARMVEAGIGAETAAAATGVSPQRFNLMRERGERVEEKIDAWYSEHPDEEAFLVDEEVLERIGVPISERRCWRLRREVDAAGARAIAVCVAAIMKAATGSPTTRTTTTVRQQLDQNGELVETTTTTQTATPSRPDWRAAAWLLEHFHSDDWGPLQPRSA